MARNISTYCVLTLMLFSLHGSGFAEIRLETIMLPPGFSISVFADNVPGARSMVQGEAGTIFVGTRREGNVYALRDTDGDYRADERYIIARGKNLPNGVAFRKGDLYVTEISKVWKLPGIEKRLADPPEPVMINDSFPSERHHGWKYIAFGPDDMLYVPVGAPCNICDPEDPRFCTIMRMNHDGSGLEIYAEGIRNTVGFDWHPDTNTLWFTDNGRDWMGDNRPPDELNAAPRKGMHFGYPYIHGRNILDPEFGEGKKPSDYIPPKQELGPHVAALGMLFYEGDMFPDEYKHQIFIAEHGSWNRSIPIGYRVTLVRLENGEAVSYEVFAEGWLQGTEDWGRPVDVITLNDGSLLVSDDKAGALYRITYSTPE